MKKADNDVNKTSRRTTVERDDKTGATPNTPHSRNLANIVVTVDVDRLRDQLDWFREVIPEHSRQRTYTDILALLQSMIANAVLTQQDRSKT